MRKAACPTAVPGVERVSHFGSEGPVYRSKERRVQAERPLVVKARYLKRKKEFTNKPVMVSD